VFVGDESIFSRFSIFSEAMTKALGANFTDADLTLKSEVLLCALNGIAHNLITISAYPWSEPEALVREAVNAVLKV
jgi:hypothetical protein